jgi:hypothetical protein
MQSFSFQTTRSVLSEVGATAKIGEIMATRGCKKVAFVTDEMILKLGLAEAALAGLKQAGVDVWLFSDVVPDPPEAMILGAIEKARSENVDGVVSVGGGSSLDTAKLIAILLNSDQPIGDMYGVGLVTGERLPLVLAPTTAGTGSEVTPISIVTTGMSEKKGVVSPQLLPDWAILDAELTVGLPANVTAATGIDAMVHAIEAYTSKHKKNLVSDCLARQALELLGANIRTVCTTPGDLEARGNMLLGSMLAGMAFANAPVADLNDNGRRDHGEPFEKDALVTTGPRLAERGTDQRGEVLVAGLANYVPVAVGVDTSTLADPMLAPKQALQVVTPRPGIAVEVDIALVGAGDIEGAIVRDGGGGFEGLDLELVDEAGKVVATTRTDFDGFFLFERAAYGRYTLRLSAETARIAGLGQSLGASVEVSGDAPVARMGAIRVIPAQQIAQGSVDNESSGATLR